MEYLEGEDLDHRLEREGVLTAPELGRIMEQVGGALTAAHIAEGLAERSPEIARLRGVATIAPHRSEESPAEAASHPLAGKSFVFTGKLAHMTRKEAQALVTSQGGSTPSGVSVALDYLVIGDDGSPLLGEGRMSSKHRKAEELVQSGSTIQIITERAFLEIFGAL